MLNLIVVAMMLAGTGVTLDKLPPRKAGKTVVIKPDAGLDPVEVVSARRQAFRSEINKMAGDRVRTILWSTAAVDEKNDGAIVLLQVGEHEIGLFFYFREGEWKTLGDDFR